MAFGTGKGRQKGSLNKATTAKIEAEAQKWAAAGTASTSETSKPRPKPKAKQKEKTWPPKQCPIEPKAQSTRALRKGTIPKKIDLDQHFSNSEDEDGDLL